MTDRSNVHQLDWITIDIATRFMQCWLRSERHAQTYLYKVAMRDGDHKQGCERFDGFMYWFAVDPCAEILFDEVANERGVPVIGTKEYMAWRIQRDITALSFKRGDLVSRIAHNPRDERKKREAQRDIKQLDRDVVDMYSLIAELRGWIQPQSRCASCNRKLHARQMVATQSS